MSPPPTGTNGDASGRLESRLRRLESAVVDLRRLVAELCTRLAPVPPHAGRPAWADQVEAIVKFGLTSNDIVEFIAEGESYRVVANGHRIDLDRAHYELFTEIARRNQKDPSAVTPVAHLVHHLHHALAYKPDVKDFAKIHRMVHTLRQKLRAVGCHENLIVSGRYAEGYTLSTPNIRFAETTPAATPTPPAR